LGKYCLAQAGRRSKQPKFGDAFRQAMAKQGKIVSEKEAESLARSLLKLVELELLKPVKAKVRLGKVFRRT
jgi:hypothetical protein